MASAVYAQICDSAKAVWWQQTQDGFVDLSNVGNVGGLEACKARCIQTTGCAGITVQNSASEATCWLETATPNSGDLPGSTYTTWIIVEAPACYCIY